MSSDVGWTVALDGVSKAYHIYDQPRDRLKQFVLPTWDRLTGRRPRVWFKEFRALQDVAFKVERGETVGLIGRNGSGKSTLLQIICGIITPTAGAVSTNGRVAALLELGSGFNPEFTGRENVRLNASILGLSDAEIDERFDTILAFADIGDFLDQPVKTYSSGMYVRLAFSVIVHCDPDILVVDEALSVGDARFQAKCMHRIDALRAAGTTILYVSHDVYSVRRLCDRVVWLDQGRVRAIGDVFKITADYTEALFADGAVEPVGESSPSSPAPEVSDDSSAEQPGYDPKPVTQWGSDVGSIVAAGIYNSAGRRTDLVEVGDIVEVRIRFRVSPDWDRSHLGAAFSIKDLRGGDLIVSTTYDRNEHGFTDGAGDYWVRFRFRNPLANGRYHLVAAIEDRSSTQIHYYEYLEGAQYFQSHSKTDLFGMFHPEIQQLVEASE